MKEFVLKADVYRVFSEIFSYPEDPESLKDLMYEVANHYPPIGELIPLMDNLQEDYMPFMKGQIPLSEGAYASYHPADVVAFYRAFGLRHRPGDNPDSLPYMLQFLSILCLKIALAPDEDTRDVALDAYRAFLKDHVGYWIGKFAQRVKEREASAFYSEAADRLADFVKEEVRDVDTAHSTA